MGLSRLGGVAPLPEAESRRALLPLGGAARLTGADLRRVGVAGVALPLVAGCRPMELLTSGGVRRTAGGLLPVAAVGLRLVGAVGVAAGRALARPEAWDPHPGQACR